MIHRGLPPAGAGYSGDEVWLTHDFHGGSVSEALRFYEWSKQMEKYGYQLTAITTNTKIIIHIL